MSTITEVLEHIQEISRSWEQALNAVYDYQENSSRLTAVAKNDLMTIIKTIPAIRVHFPDCPICTGWTED